MAKTRVLNTKRNKQDNGTHYLISLPPGWEPWKYQISSMVDDGKAYESPGKETCTGWINFETAEKALERFNKIEGKLIPNKED